MSNANPLHSSLSNEHYTPSSIVTPARAVLECIDLDPASCEFAQQLVDADNWYDQSDNGLTRFWSGYGSESCRAGDAARVFLNPPGGKYDKAGNPVKTGPGRSSAAVWWAKLIAEWRAERVHSAIFVCFSLNIFRTAQSECNIAPYEFPFVVCGDRVRFDKQGPNGERVPGNAPQQDSAIVYVPPRTAWGTYVRGASSPHTDIHRFEENFSALGAVRL